MRQAYPFTSIVGQEQMKLALLLNAINPRVGGVLVRGERGTAKSTAVRAPAAPRDRCPDCRARIDAGETLPVAVTRMRVVELPVGASEDRVVGSIDIEAAIRPGDRRFEPGLLAPANRK